MKYETDQNMEQLFQKYLQMHISNLTEGYSALEVAGVIASQALMLYKTVLSDQDYNSMVKCIFDTRHTVRELDPSWESRSLQ